MYENHYVMKVLNFSSSSPSLTFTSLRNIFIFFDLEFWINWKNYTVFKRGVFVHHKELHQRIQQGEINDVFYDEKGLSHMVLIKINKEHRVMKARWITHTALFPRSHMSFSEEERSKQPSM